MSATVDPLVPLIREASRRLVREWGFLRGGGLANTTLSPSAVHCLYEIGENGARSGPALVEALAFEEADLIRSIQELTSAGEVEATAAAVGERLFAVTTKGRETLDAINLIATSQVQAALGVCAPAAASAVLGGLQTYAAALQALRLQAAPILPDTVSDAAPAATATAAAAAVTPPAVRIVSGYQMGLLARSLEMHMRYYHAHHGFGQTFESLLGAGLADLVGRLDRPVNGAWAAVQETPAGDQIVGTIFIDGDDPSRPGQVARLRAFIVDEHARGSGAGKKLFTAAMGFVRRVGFDEVQLTTMRSLAVARRLYEAAGFVLQSEEERMEFGVPTMVMTYLWRRPDSLGAAPSASEMARPIALETSKVA